MMLKKDPTINIIVATNKNNVIGKDGDIPWNYRNDLKHFQRMTKDKVVIMGRKTFESLGNKPLKDRMNIVLTRQVKSIEIDSAFSGGIKIMDSIEEALGYALCFCDDKDIWLIGGQEVYREGMNYVHSLYVTEVPDDVEGDTFFPEIDSNVWELSDNIEIESTEKDPTLICKVYKRKGLK